MTFSLRRTHVAIIGLIAFAATASVFSADGTTGRGTTYTHIYKLQPCDTTMATIDELRISKRAWTTIEIQDEMTLSRYYLPADPSGKNTAVLPTFISQSLIQSLEGTKVTSDDLVAVARVSWNVFTPRFMHEYKVPDHYQRNEIIYGNKQKTYFRGPFDYSQYNWDIDYDANNGWKNAGVNPRNPYLCVDRVPPDLGTQSSWSKGVTVDLVQILNSGSKTLGTAKLLQGYVMDRVTKKSILVDTFHDPEAENCYINPSKPGLRQLVKAGELHYRVRFQYPVDRKHIDTVATKDTVDPNIHYMLDTPVFDDISIVYVQAPKILYFKEAVE